eukprot:COSAG01_NODE_66992_length_268_cov_0.899408_1_plen_43_part_10
MRFSAVHPGRPLDHDHYVLRVRLLLCPPWSGSDSGGEVEVRRA